MGKRNKSNLVLRGTASVSGIFACFYFFWICMCRKLCIAGKFIFRGKDIKNGVEF